MRQQAGSALEVPVALPRRPVRHLLVVAGARGAGKTTFLKALAAGRLDASTSARIPRGAASWPQVEASDHADWMPIIIAAEGPVRNLALHYDLINFRGRIGEPALEALTLARKVTVVNIKPEGTQLATQFSARTSDAVQRALSGGALDDLWNHVARPLIAPRYYLAAGAEQARYLEQMRQFFLTRYGDAAWIEDTYRSWGVTVARLTAGATLRVIDIQPIGPAQSGEFRWALR